MTAPISAHPPAHTALSALSAKRQTVHIGATENAPTDTPGKTGLQKGIATCLSTFSTKLRGLLGGKKATSTAAPDHAPEMTQVAVPTAESNDSPPSELHLALQDTAKILCKELNLDWDMASLTETLMEPQTIHHILSEVGPLKDEVSVIFGRLICLNHQITPYENLNQTLKEAGISHTDSQLEKLYTQGFRSETEVSDAVKTSQSFATKLAANPKFKQAMRYALTERLDILSVHFQRSAMAKLLGITGMSEEALPQFRQALGRQVDLADQSKSGKSLKGVKVITGSVRSSLHRVFSSKTAIGQLSKIQDKEGAKKTSSFKSIRQLSMIVRLAILEHISESGKATDVAVSELQAGTSNEILFSKMASFGLTDAHFTELGGAGISDMKGLIAVEAKTFKGTESVKEWLSEMNVAETTISQLQRRESMENKTEIAATLPTTLAKRETTSWLEEMKPGGTLMIDWGKKISVGIPEGSKLIQESFLSGQSIGGRLDVSSSDMMMLERSGTGFSLTIRESAVKTLAIDASFLFQAIRLEGKLGGGKSSGLKFNFSSVDDAAHFLTGLWTTQVDESKLGRADTVHNEKGKIRAVGGSFTISSVQKVMTHFLPGLANVQDLLPGLGQLKAFIDSPTDVISEGMGTSTITASKSVGVLSSLTSNTDQSDEKNIFRHAKNQQSEWVESQNIHGATFEKSVLSSVQTEKMGHTTTTNVLTHSHVSTDSSGAFKSADMTQTLSVTLPEVKKGPKPTVSAQSIALVLPSEIQGHPQFKTAVADLLAKATPADQIKVTWALSPDSQKTVATLMGQGSATAADVQKLLGDRRNYIPTSVQLLRTSATVSEASKTGIDLAAVLRHQTMAQVTVAEEVNLVP